MREVGKGVRRNSATELFESLFLTIGRASSRYFYPFSWLADIVLITSK